MIIGVQTEKRPPGFGGPLSPIIARVSPPAAGPPAALEAAVVVPPVPAGPVPHTVAALVLLAPPVVTVRLDDPRRRSCGGGGRQDHRSGDGCRCSRGCRSRLRCTRKSKQQGSGQDRRCAHCCEPAPDSSCQAAHLVFRVAVRAANFHSNLSERQGEYKRSLNLISASMSRAAIAAPTVACVAVGVVRSHVRHDGLRIRCGAKCVEREPENGHRNGIDVNTVIEVAPVVDGTPGRRPGGVVE